MSAYNPNKQGWGFAAVVCVLTAGLFFTAKTIHDRTYRHPRDPMTTQVYHDRDGASHDAPAADHAAPAGDTHTPAAADTGHKEAAKPAAAKH
jgi:hypothetical protein